MSRTVVIGGGISGLALAWFLKSSGKASSLSILEASERVGGWIRTHHHNGYLFEAGPRSCRTRGAGIATLELIEELGLTDEVIAASGSARKRYLYRGGSLQKLPDSLWSFFTSPLMRGVLPALWKDLWSQPGTKDDETIAEFISRRLSPEIAARLMDPLVSGIYAGDIRNLSMRSCFPEIFQLEKEHGCLVKGMFKKKALDVPASPFVKNMLSEPIFSFRNGMETLVIALKERLKDELEISTRVTGLKLLPDCIELKAQDGRTWHVDKVYLAIPSNAASALLKQVGIPTMDISSVSVAVVNMGWKDNVLPHDGFGYLVPSGEQQPVLGVVWDSSAFPLQNTWPHQTRLTAMLGGAHQPFVKNLTEEQIVDTARYAIKRHLGIERCPNETSVTLACHSIPQYTLGHDARVKSLEEEVTRASKGRVCLAGSAWHGVSVNECIANAKRLVLM